MARRRWTVTAVSLLALLVVPALTAFAAASPCPAQPPVAVTVAFPDGQNATLLNGGHLTFTATVTPTAAGASTVALDIMVEGIASPQGPVSFTLPTSAALGGAKTVTLGLDVPPATLFVAVTATASARCGATNTASTLQKWFPVGSGTGQIFLQL